MDAVTEILKKIIDEKGIKYTFISSKTGIPIDTISRSFLGKRRLPANEMIEICKAIKIDIDDLNCIFTADNREE